MTFAAHSVLGAGLCALPFARCKPWVKWTASVFGAIGGAAPDAADWLAWALFGAERWTLYTRMHTGDLVDWFAWHPAYCLHLILDSAIHLYPGYNWWSDYWWLEVGCWLAGAGMLWIVWTKGES